MSLRCRSSCFDDGLRLSLYFPQCSIVRGFNGSIHFVIRSVIFEMKVRFGRVLFLADKIHWCDLLLYRIFNGLFQPLMIALVYSLIVLWLFTMDSFGHFLRYWMFNWLAAMIYTTTIALFTINFGRFANTCLVVLLILMISGSTIQLSIELSPSFYRYGYGLPLYHIINGSRHLLFHSSTNFPLHIGVLLIYNAFLWAGVILTSMVRHADFTLKKASCFLLIQRQKTSEGIKDIE